MGGNQSVSDKNFKKELEKIISYLESGKHFVLSKYADGEWNIINENPAWGHVDGWYYLPYVDKFYRDRLLESFVYEHPDYLVGISCRCCAGDEVHEQMKEVSGQPIENLTFANVLVNSNYDTYLTKIIPLYMHYKVYLVAHEDAQIKNLPFGIKKHYPISKIAWKNDYSLIDDIKEEIKSKDIQNSLFLFAAGPLGNMMAHQLWEASPHNTYLDIGSTLNPLMEMGKNRGYLKGASTSQRECVWK
jgi:hypothetical protein|tara:strand:- start:207 stop:941 length:735 start_codon:yes stop_codon:yes gene_type:complete